MVKNVLEKVGIEFIVELYDFIMKVIGKLMDNIDVNLVIKIDVFVVIFKLLDFEFVVEVVNGLVDNYLDYKFFI